MHKSKWLISRHLSGWIPKSQIDSHWMDSQIDALLIRDVSQALCCPEGRRSWHSAKMVFKLCFFLSQNWARDVNMLPVLKKMSSFQECSNNTQIWCNKCQLLSSRGSQR